jgi:hypothetical protein
MSANSLKVVGEVVDPEFLELDEAITDCIRDFVQLGELLIRMRDGQSYRTAGFDSFKDYCKAKAGLTYQHSCDVISYCLVFQCIAESGISESLPQTMEHVRQLAPIANINYEERVVEKADGTKTKVKQPVGVRNPTKVAEQWTKTVKEFERLDQKAIDEGKKRPTFSGKFVRNQLPNDLKITPNRSFDCNPLVRLSARMDKLHEDMKQQGFTDKRKVPVLIKAEPPCLSVELNDLRNQLEAVQADIDKLLAILDEYE